MGGTKTKTSQDYQGVNTFDWKTTPDTPDIQAVRDFKITADPRIPYLYGSAKRNIAGTYRNPLGANQTAATRDAGQRTQFADLAQSEAEASNESYQGTQGARFGQKLSVAQMTAPRLVQSGQSGSQSGTQTVTKSPFDTIMEGAAGMGSALLM